KQEVKILIGFDQLIHNKQRVVRRHIIIQRSMRQQQMALQVFGKVLIGLVIVIGGAVGILDEQSLIPLAPIVLVLAIVVIAGLRYPHFKKIGVAEHGVSRRVASAGMAINPCAITINPRLL